MKIYKYVLETDKLVELQLPAGAKVIHCHEQANKPCIWVSFKQGDTLEKRSFFAMVTGVDFPGGTHIGTCHLDNGKFVVHIFED